MRQCICQICVCGRHHCEHTAKQRVPFAKDKDDANKITEHKDRYRHFGYHPPESPIRPISGADWKGNEPSVKLSTARHDYVPLPIERRSLMRPKTYKEPKGKMDCSTTYQHDFKPRKGHRRSKIKLAECAKDGTMPGSMPGKIEGDTTYGISYQPKQSSRRQPAKGKECTLTKLGLPFRSGTETARSYQAPPYQKREMIRPRDEALKLEGDFEGYTTHRTDYPPKYQPPPKLIKKFAKWKPGTGKFEGVTTHAHDFRYPLQQQMARPCIPKGDIQKFEGSFEGVSHYKADYPPHEVTTRKVPKWHPSRKQQKTFEGGPMLGQTTYKTDYEAPPEDIPLAERKPIKNNLTIPSGPMEKTSTSMRDFVKIDNPVLSKSFKPDIHYKKPEGKFADCTTTGCDYTAKMAEKTEKMKREDNLGREDGPMEDLTTTMRDFQAICIDCPAKYLKLYGKDALPQYKFEKTEKGHDYFKKLKNKKKS
ncbi:uncharacterized protein NPIL_701761 [Nephila pilipes]|uniref:Uncharacterized protein n=1 Tax=Nephila pilipes TaxID=299642 RepID=A0A8X6TBS6_NEPPI|nr:uncharacterized protein NPIL_701761 [Nephila pilipes]